MIFFFNDTATTEIYTLSLHDALPISVIRRHREKKRHTQKDRAEVFGHLLVQQRQSSEFHGTVCYAHHGCEKRSEEHTSELQSRLHLVCRLLLEKKKW